MMTMNIMNTPLFGMSNEQETELQVIMKYIENKGIPLSYPQFISRNFGALAYRERLRYLSGYALLSKDWLCPLSRWIKAQKAYKQNPQVLEIMAGSGALSYGMKNEGINIKATDSKTWAWEWKEWTEVEKLSALDAIAKYIKECSFMLCSWAFMNSDLYNSLLLMRKLNPLCRLVYIGESEGGCTADHEFFKAIERIEDHKFTKAVKNYRRFCTLYDSVRLGK